MLQPYGLTADYFDIPFTLETIDRCAEAIKPAADMFSDAKISDVVARHEADLLKFPNVVGVFTGLRTRGGVPTHEPCVTVLVRQKIPADQLPDDDLLPSALDGVCVDVMEVGEIVTL